MLEILLDHTLRTLPVYACAAMGGILAERSGVVHLGLEGIVLSSALAASMAALATGSFVVAGVAALGTGLLLGALHGYASTRGRVDDVVSGLALPDRPDSPASTHRASTPRAVSTGDGPTTQVRVRAGDTLWAIAARSLPDGASDADVAAATTAWHRANVDVIGDDPDLIVPAQLLVPPSGKDLS